MIKKLWNERYISKGNLKTKQSLLLLRTVTETKESFFFQPINKAYVLNQSTQTSIELMVNSSEDVDSKHRTILGETSCSHPAKEEPPSVIASLNPSLCQNCSKSMLSYIVLVQRFLDNVAREVSRQVDPLAQCFECVKESLKLPPLSFPNHHHSHTASQGNYSNNGGNQAFNAHSTSENPKTSENYGPSMNQFVTYDEKPVENDERKKPSNASTHDRISLDETPLQNDSRSKQKADSFKDNENNKNETSGAAPCSNNMSAEKVHSKCTDSHSNQGFETKLILTSSTKENYESKEFTNMNTTDDLQNFAFDGKNQAIPSPNRNNDNCKEINLQHETMPATRPDSLIFPDGLRTNEYSDDTASHQYCAESCVDGILTRLHWVEGSFHEWSESSTIWEKLDHLKGESTTERITDEAFVTFARSNSDVLGCLALGASLILCDTSRTVCVLVADCVDASFMVLLSTVFHEVHHIRSLDSIGTTKLSLLDQPELGITFGKLNIWRLTQYRKCVFLSSDTMVLQNCDELFCYEELSAVADIGWPDCFNSAVFVYQPSTDTFWKLLAYAEKEGSYDGGDQGLLNSYFNMWSQDIHKKLSFIYNLMANVSYTYTPAFKQFGRSVKVVQFMGAYKPWHVKFFSGSGQIAPSSSVHPTYVQFVYVWLNIFRISVLPGFTEDMRAYASSHNVISASEMLQFFPAQLDSEMDFPTPPSVRLHPLTSQFTFPPVLEKLKLPAKINFPDPSSLIPPLTPEDNLLNPLLSMKLDDKNQDEDSYYENVLQMETRQRDDDEEDERKRENHIPGSEFGDYQGMTAWEQGRMDYEGNASSDTIIQRLRYLMKNPEQKFSQ